MMPGQKASGTNGISVVAVPANTGRKTSPVAILAACAIGILPLSNIRCVFSITTIASSTTIPSASRKENNTIMFIVKPIVGKTRKAMAQDSGTDIATNRALVTPMKNIRIIVTSINPMMIVLIRSVSVDLVFSDWSPVTTIFRSLGSSVPCIFFISSVMLSDASIRFWPLAFITFRVITLLPSRRAKLFCSWKLSVTSAISRR